MRTHYLHADQLGSIIGISDSSGASAERRAYHPFGKIAWEVRQSWFLEMRPADLMKH